jgi:CDP-diacylglycerol--glycerol-3-phosphate 3-phosphatidyltransferase
MTLWKPLDWFLYKVFLSWWPRWIEPNHITVFRFISIPFVIYFIITGNYTIGIPLFAISAFSDALDGALARMTLQVTEWGKLYDPLADKLLIGSVAAIVVTQYFGVLVTILILGVEVILVLTSWWKKHFLKKKKIEAGIIGKVKMVLQSVGVGLLLVYAVNGSALVFGISEILIAAAIICAIGSLFTYNSV